MTADTFQVVGFEVHQHYKDRSPPWIKLHTKYLDDYEFSRLQDASKAHLLSILLLASRNNNRIPWDAEWIGRQINATTPVDLEALENGGFIERSGKRSKTLARRKQTACLDKSRGEEKRLEESREEVAGAAAPAADAALQISEAVNQFNQLADELSLPKVREVTDERRRKFRARFANGHGREKFAAALDALRRTPFCLGENDRGWRADFDFLLQPKSLTRLLEGAYSGGTGPPGRRSVTELLRELEDGDHAGE